MPVGSHQVPLDTAKNWAKRLAKTSKTLSPTDPWALSKCQLAVAQMLGYKHWHDMEAGLNSGTTDTLASGVLQANTAYPTNYQGCIPETPEQWQQFWANAVSSVHRTHFYIEFRAQSLSISRHILGRILPYLTLPREVLKDALGPIFDQQMIEGLVRENLTGLVTGQVYIRGINPTSTRYNFLPVYPGGWDIAIELPAKEATPSLGLGNMGLPKEVVGAIQKIATRRVGAFLFSGSIGTGRASLMRAVIDDLHGNLLPDEHEVPHAKAIPVIGSKVDNNHLTLRKSSIAKIYAITQKHERLPHTTQHQTNGTEKADREAFAACMRQDPDVFVIDEIVTSTKAAMLREATERGVLALATVVSSPHNVLDRMADFDQQANWGELINGWAACRYVPVLCKTCSTQGVGALRLRGTGCTTCQGFGYERLQLTVDLWEVRDGTPYRLFKATDQAKHLAELGWVELRDAQNALGPLD